MNKSGLAFIVFIICLGCNPEKFHTGQLQNEPDTTIDQVRFAQGFTLEVQNRCTTVKVINPWQHAAGVAFTYLLSDTLSASGMLDEHSWKIKTPVKKVVCLSTTHVGFLDYLNKTGTVTGISGREYVVNQELRHAIENGQVFDVGYDENLNFEMLLKMKPDVVFAYGVSVTVTKTVRKLNELGIPVILIGEYLEQDPLAKMEWVKVFAACYGMNNRVYERFDSTVLQYRKLTDLAANINHYPLVLLGLPWRGNWYISGSKSYVAQMVKDAGGKYIWDHLDFNESRPMSLEGIYEHALTADYWLNPGDAITKADILLVDERFKSLPSFKSGNIFNNNNLMVKSGGNAFFESGVVEPEIILADLIHILHPQALPSHTLKYYRKLH